MNTKALILAIAAFMLCLGRLAHSYPSWMLNAAAKIAVHVVVAEVEKPYRVTIQKPRISWFETRITVVQALKGNFLPGKRIVVRIGEGPSIPPRETPFHFISQNAVRHLVWLRDARDSEGPRFETGGRSVPLSEPFMEDDYYLDMKTALAVVAGSTQTFRQRRPSLTADEAASALKVQVEKLYCEEHRDNPCRIVQWDLRKAVLANESWLLTVRWKVDGQKVDAVTAGETTYSVDAETGLNLGEFCAYTD